MTTDIPFPLDLKWATPSFTHFVDPAGHAWVILAVPAPSAEEAEKVVRVYTEKVNGPVPYGLDINLKEV